MTLESLVSLTDEGQYELMLFEAEHSAFSDHDLTWREKARNPNHRLAILVLSTAFFDCYLIEGKAAKAWLDGKVPRMMLEAQDA